MKLFTLAALVVSIAQVVQGQELALDERTSETLSAPSASATVPPLLELTPSNWASESKKTRWLLVKHYSPYCPHCADFKPIYQTLYEFYYTYKIAPGTSFEDFYGFRFGLLNCVAYSDLCVDHEVKSFPQTILYENGVKFDSISGAKNISMMSNFVEVALEKTKPGSRPKNIVLPVPPEPDYSDFPDEDEESAVETSSSADKVMTTTEEVRGKPTEDSYKGPTDMKKSGNDKAKESVLDKTKQELDSWKNTVVDKMKSAAGKKEAKEMAKPSEATATSGSDWKVSPVTGIEKPTRPKEQAASYNKEGYPVSLTAESFQKLVTLSQDPWFIKFYAPWCPHCRDLAPTWEQLAKSMRGKLNIGQVNCDKEPRLCKDVNARSFPTIIFFKGAERVEYIGLRSLGDFVHYSEKAINLASGVSDVDAESLKALEEKEDVIFVYFYDHATTSEDFRALDRLPLGIIGHAKLVKTSDPKLNERFKITTWPRLMVSREGRPSYYPPLTPDEMRDVRAVLDWMKSVWLPLVPELTPSNARQIMDGKIVALGILNRQDKETFQSSIREMKSAAHEWSDRQVQEFQLERKKLRDSKQMRIEEAEDRGDQRALRTAKAIRIDMDTAGRKEVTFAWVDGVFWQRWIRTTYGIDVKDGERIIINDEDNRRYWDNTATGNHVLVSRTSIMETLDKIVYSPHIIKHKLTVSPVEKVFYDMRQAFFDHPFLSVACIAGTGFGLVSWLRGRNRRRGAYFRLDDNMNMRELKKGLLGTSGNQKAD